MGSIVTETPSVKTFRLLSSSNDSPMPFTFVPGQFLNVAFSIGGARMNRSYSISSSPDREDGCITLTVKAIEGWRMSHYLVRQLETKSNVRVALHSEIIAVHGREQLEAVDVADRRNATEQRHAAGGLFVFIGADAATDWLPVEIARDERGYVLTGADAAQSARFSAPRAPQLLETTVPGVFAVGDIRAGSVKRVASAVGDGSLAITFVRQYLENYSGL